MKNKISREDFIKTSAFALAATFTPNNLFSKANEINSSIDEPMMARLLKVNDKSVEEFLKKQNDSPQIQYYRNLSGAFANLTASFCHPKSFYFKSNEVISSLSNIIDNLIELQYPNGTLDSGGNRQSPPDTAFLLEALCTSAEIINKNNFEELSNVKEKLDKFLLNAGEGIRKGGIHTPNHRWEVSSVLAQLYSLFKNEKYVERIDEWLAEGIYMNEDGNFPERSRNYSVVENKSFIHIAEKLNRPKLFEIVQKSLITNYYYMELNGELVSLDSRRQDQYKPISIVLFYLIYRYMAIHENDGFLAAIAREIEAVDEFDKSVLSRALPFFMASPILSKELPKSEPLPKNFTKHFVQSDLVRIKRGDSTASIFGGNDQPIIIASGRSCDPTFLHSERDSQYSNTQDYQHFFNTGYVRAAGLKKEENKYILNEKKEAYYYQPLPKDKLNKNGDYKLTESLDGRFWSKLDFASRPKTTLTLDSQITIEEIDNAFKIDFEINGPDKVGVVLDLCFRKGGTLEGVIPAYEEDEFFLENGFAKYTFGSDSIEVGPGKSEHKYVKNLDGEVYSTHFGSIKGEGQHLYITGYVPFKHSITIK